jgi:glycosyltransferase involved in cell wall biosynthesis
MRIAMVSEHASPLAAMGGPGLGGADGGGQNVHVYALAAELGRLGHRVTVYTRRDSPRLPVRVEMAPGVTVEHVPAGPPRLLAKDLLLPYMPAFGRYLARRWAADPPDLAHAHFWMSGLAALAAAKDLDLPVLQTFHALGVVKRRHQGAMDTSPPERLPLERSVAVRATAIVSTSAEEAAELRGWGVPAERVHVVPCGVEIDRFRPDGPAYPRSDLRRLLYLGRLVERKGVDAVVEALADIPGTELLIAGGPPRDRLGGDPDVRRLRAAVARAGVADRVTFLGRTAHGEVPALIRSADVVVSVPWYEPFGIVPVEAMACGVPVAASPVGGHVDSVVDGVTGVHVPARDPAAIAARLRDLLADGPRRRSLGAAAAHRARSRYSWERVARQTQAAYDSAVKAAGTKVRARAS